MTEEKDIKEVKKSSRFKAPGKKSKAEKVGEEVIEETKKEEIPLVIEEVKEEIKKEEAPIAVKTAKKATEAPDKSNGASELLMSLVKLLVGIFIWFPAFLVVLCCLVALGIAIALAISSWIFLWLLFIVTGIFMIALAIIIPISKLIWGKDKK